MKSPFFFLNSLLIASLAGIGSNLHAAASEEPNPAQLAAYKAYLGKVDAAEALADPVQRCMAYPALPGVTWTPQHIEAHCRYHHEPVISLEQMQALVDSGRFDELESVFTDYQARHQASVGQSEIIHRAYEFLADRQAGDVTSKWLAHSPDSAFALTARAEFLRNMAWDARGSKFAADTSSDKFAMMSEIVKQAVPLYQKAVRINPSLLPAHVGLINIGMLDSDAKIESSARESAMAADPMCADMMRRTLTALTPRWGGSHAQMMEYLVEVVEPSIAKRPLNGQYMAYVIEDIISTSSNKDGGNAEQVHLINPGLKFGANEDLMDSASEIYDEIGRFDLENMYVLQEIRFRGGSQADYNNAGAQLVDFGYYPSAQKFLERAHAMDAKDTYPVYNLARMYYQKQDYARAIEYAKQAREHPIHRFRSQSILVYSLLGTAQLDDARKNAAVLTAEFPTEPYAWLARLICEMESKMKPEATRSLAQLEAFMPEDNPELDEAVKFARNFLKQAD